MKEKSLFFTQEEFQTFMLKKIQEVFPDVRFVIEEFFTISIQQDGKEKGKLHLHNAWNGYESSGDLNEVLHYLEAMIATQQHIHDESLTFTYPKDKESIYPSIRPTNYAQETITSEEGERKTDLITQPIAGDVMFMYILDYPQFVVAMTEDMLLKNVRNEENKHMSEEELKKTNGYQYLKEMVIEQAWENQKKRGWVKYSVRKKTPFGLFYHFHHPEYEYQGQFFIKEWTKKHLGPLFYITFPTKNSTLVLVPNGTTPQVRHLGKQLLLLDNERVRQHERNYMTSSHVYMVHPDKGITLA